MSGPFFVGGEHGRTRYFAIGRLDRMRMEERTELEPFVRHQRVLELPDVRWWLRAGYNVTCDRAGILWGIPVRLSLAQARNRRQLQPETR